MKARIGIIIMSLILSIISCQKDNVFVEQAKESPNLAIKPFTEQEIIDYIKSDQVLTRFFYGSEAQFYSEGLEQRGDDPALEAIKLEMARQDMEGKFVKKFEKKYGTAVWGVGSKIDFNENDKYFRIIPLVSVKDSSVNAIIAVFRNQDHFNFEMMDRGDISKLMSKTNWKSSRPNFLAFLTNFLVTENKLFGKSTATYIDWLKKYLDNSQVSRLEARDFIMNVCESVCTEWRSDYAINQLEIRSTCVSVRVSCSNYSVSTGGGGGFTGTYTSISSPTGVNGGNCWYCNYTTSTLMTSAQQVRLEYLETSLELTYEQLVYFELNPFRIDQVYNAYKSSSNAEIRANAVFDVLINTWGFSKTEEVLKEIAYLKLTIPGKSLAYYVTHGMWNVLNGSIHTFLDLAGLVPAIGEVADLANAAIYLMQGDKANATFSALGAVPVAGWVSTGAKYGAKVLRKADGTKEIFQFVVDATGKIDFGNSGQLRNVLNLNVGNPLRAHHIIPVEHMKHDVIQKIAKLGKFHMNAKFNGFAIDQARHLSDHTLYNSKVFDALQILNSNTPDVAYDRLRNYMFKLENELASGKTFSQLDYSIN